MAWLGLYLLLVTWLLIPSQATDEQLNLYHARLRLREATDNAKLAMAKLVR